MLNVLVTGSGGQVGSELRMLNDDFLIMNYQCFFTTRESLDIARKESVEKFCIDILEWYIVNPIETKEYPTPASRPHYSLLNKSKIKKDFDIIIPYWKDSLKECLKIIKERR